MSNVDMSTLTREQQREIGALKVSTDRMREQCLSTVSLTIYVPADTIEWLTIVGGDVFRDYPAKVRRRMASEGTALPDGCLSGDTLIATQEGPRPIGSCCGKTKVLTDAGWAEAEIRSYGTASLFEVEFTRDGERAVVLATPNHRWYLADGSVVRTDELVSQVGDRGFYPDVVEPTDLGIAADAEQASYLSSHVAMIDMESRPLSSSAVTSAGCGNLIADRAPSTLLLDHPNEVRVGDSVLATQNSVPAYHPTGIADLDRLSTDARLCPDATLAFGAPSLVPHVEISMGEILSAETTDDLADVIDRHPGRSFGFGHGVNAIQNDWRVAAVRATGLRERVFCAEVPTLHRFVLANGILTGNSFPIADCSDAADAIHSIGRAAPEKRAKAEAHIRKRVRALRCQGSVYENWK